MKKIIYITLLLFAHIAMAQTDADYDSSLKEIAEAYNAKDSSKIFDLFSEDLKTTFTLEKVKVFLDDTHTNKGLMGEQTFLTDEEGEKTYLVEFDSISSIIIISLTTDKKLSKLSIEEY